MSDDILVVAPEGRATIEHARGLKESLERAFAESSSVVLDLSALSTIDLTAIHLVYAAQRHAEKSGKEFHLSGTIATDVADAFQVGGFTKKVVGDGEELERSLVDFRTLTDG